MNMGQRATLIASLEARRFTAGALENYGWTYIHKDAGFSVWFDNNGKFRFTCDESPTNSITKTGTMETPEHLLSLIDKAAAAL